VAIPRRERRSQVQESDHQENHRPRIAKIEAAALQLVQQEEHANRYEDRRTRQAADRAALAMASDLVAHRLTPLRPWSSLLPAHALSQQQETYPN
jgi:hypothetical protein